jgi:hypothetical protein
MRWARNSFQVSGYAQNMREKELQKQKEGGKGRAHAAVDINHYYRELILSHPHRNAATIVFFFSVCNCGVDSSDTSISIGTCQRRC